MMYANIKKGVFFVFIVCMGCQQTNTKHASKDAAIEDINQNCCESNFAFVDGLLDFKLLPCAEEEQTPVAFGNLMDPKANEDCGTEGSFFMEYIVVDGMFVCNFDACHCGEQMIGLGETCYFPLRHFKPNMLDKKCTGAAGFCLQSHYLREVDAWQNPSGAVTLLEGALCSGMHCQCGHRETKDGKCEGTGYPFCGIQTYYHEDSAAEAWFDFGPENIEDYACKPVSDKAFQKVQRTQEVIRKIRSASKTLPNGFHAHGAYVDVIPKGKLLSNPELAEYAWICQKESCACGAVMVKEGEACHTVRTNIYGKCKNNRVPDTEEGMCAIDFKLDRIAGGRTYGR
jgi:hypothetical protein